MAINRNAKTSEELFGFPVVVMTREEFEAKYPKANYERDAVIAFEDPLKVPSAAPVNRREV